MKGLFKTPRIIVALLLTILLSSLFAPVYAVIQPLQIETEENIPVTGISINNISGGSLYLSTGDEFILDVEIQPSNATNKNIIIENFTPSRPNIFTFNNSTGKINAHEAGFTLVYVKSADNTSVMTAFVLYVALPTSGYEHPYEPGQWNDNSTVQNLTTCYNYALNLQTHPQVHGISGYQIGAFSGSPVTSSDIGFNGSGVIQKLQADSVSSVRKFKFEPIGKYEQCSPGSYKIAVTFSVYSKYHIYRQNADGTWSHKLGSRPVTNKDAFGGVIYDPDIAQKNYTSVGDDSYTWIIGYYEVSVNTPTTGFELQYQPEKWNYNPVQSSTNCYNYALNNQCWYPGFNHLYRMQPGSLNVISQYLPLPNPWPIYVGPDGTNVISLVQQDSNDNARFIFTPVGKYSQVVLGSYKVALVIAPNNDYHWYRQNKDGTWSHKPGGQEVTLLDASGNIIYDPESADRDYSSTGGYNYTHFAGFFNMTPLNNMYTPY